MTQSHSPGILLLNLGSPSSTDTKDVRVYLREFLSDPRVIDIPTPIRKMVLELFILPFRPKKSAHAYKSIWTEQGSPLVVTTYKVADLLRERLEEVPVEVGMRYGEPSTEDGIRRLINRGVNDMLVIPLYPHYAMSSYETAVAKAQERAAAMAPGMRVTILPPFYNHPRYIEALVKVAKPYLEDEEGFDRLLFSYHGIPERHLRKSDPSGCYCLQYEDCCEREHPAHSVCYRHQCFETTKHFAKAANLKPEQYSVSFQSRLGSDPWLSPYTDFELERLPTEQVKRLLVICPAFVSDCLETLEEINMEGRETFMEAGGKSFRYIPCLNEDEAWIDVLEHFSRQFITRSELLSEQAREEEDGAQGASDVANPLSDVRVS